MDHWVVQLGILCTTGHTVSSHSTEVSNWSWLCYPALACKHQVTANQLFFFVLVMNHLHHFQKLCLTSSPHPCFLFQPLSIHSFFTMKICRCYKQVTSQSSFFGKLTRMNLSPFSEVSLPTPLFILRLFSFPV